MRIPRIYTEQALQGDASLTLEPAASRHLSRALRKGPGEKIIIFNGTGGQYTAEIIALGKKAVHVHCQQLDTLERESVLSTHLGIALSRGERMDWVVQKATELGVTSIHPLHTENTGVKITADRVDKKLRHWRNTVISACEQCGRNRLPSIAEPQELDTWLHNTDADLKLVLHPSSQRPNDGTKDSQAKPSSVALLIGPEGGLTEGEIGAAQMAGFEAIQLGPRVLRTETAPLVALAMLQARWGDISFT